MILLYHLVFPDKTPADAWNAGKVMRLSQFVRQIEWLRGHYTIVSLNDYLMQVPNGNKIASITFDDGYQRTFDPVHEYLERNHIPATFFANTSHLEDGKLLWFVFINALCFERVYEQIEIDGVKFKLRNEKECVTLWKYLIRKARESGNAIAFSNELDNRFPLPEEVIAKYSGLSREQLIGIGNSEFLELGGHTHHHPYLDQLDFQEQKAEISRNKTILEQFSQKPTRFFAYTGGVYDNKSIQAVKDSGFTAAFAVVPTNLGVDPTYEIPRVDIYSPSLIKFFLKTLIHEKLNNWSKGQHR